MKPEELEVGKTYIGKTGKPRTITRVAKYLAGNEIYYTRTGGKTECSSWGFRFAEWAKEVQK